MSLIWSYVESLGSLLYLKVYTLKHIYKVPTVQYSLILQINM